MGRNDSYRGFEVWFNDFKMAFKMYWVLGLVLGSVHLVLFVGVARAWLGEMDAHLFWNWGVARAFAVWKPDHVMTFAYNGEAYRMSAAQLAGYLEPYLAGFLLRLLLAFLATSGVYVTLPLFTRGFRRKARNLTGPEHVRGSRRATAAEFRRELKRVYGGLDLPLGEFRLPKEEEVKHVLVIGRPGVGKTVALSAVIARLRARGERGVIYDNKGDYTARFFRPGKDLLFNPLDTRCAGWNLFNDIDTQMDVDAIAASLIPRAYHADPYWNDAARAVFTGLLHHLYATGRRDNASIWDVVSSDVKEIARWLQKTPHGEAGYTFIQDAGSKQALSVHSVVMQYARPFEFLAGVHGDFSAVEWLRRGEGWVFVTNYADIRDTLRPILSLFVDLLGRKLLAMPDDYDRRLFFFLDEFGTLQRLSTIVDLLTLSRSKGGSVWVGIQDVGQIDKLYTKELRQAIVNACGTSVIFGVADPDAAKFLSEKFGEREVLEMDQTYSMGPSDLRDGVSLAQRKKKETLVLPSELMSLPDLTAYLRIGGLPVTKTRFQFRPYPCGQPAFTLRPDLRLDARTAASHSATVSPGPSAGADPEGGSRTLEVPFEREEHRDPSDPPEVPEYPSWIDGPQTRDKADEDEGHQRVRREHEELFHDGAVDPEEKERDEDGSRAIDIPGGLDGPMGL